MNNIEFTHIDSDPTIFFVKYLMSPPRCDPTTHFFKEGTYMPLEKEFAKGYEFLQNSEFPLNLVSSQFLVGSC